MPTFSLGNQLLMLFMRFLCIFPLWAVKSMIYVWHCMRQPFHWLTFDFKRRKKNRKKSIWILTTVFWTSTFLFVLTCLSSINLSLMSYGTNSSYKRGRIVENDTKEIVSTKRYKVIRKYIYRNKVVFNDCAKLKHPSRVSLKPFYFPNRPFRQLKNSCKTFTQNNGSFCDKITTFAKVNPYTFLTQCQFGQNRKWDAMWWALYFKRLYNWFWHYR